jgi:hypothetical protein
MPLGIVESQSSHCSIRVGKDFFVHVFPRS